MLSVQQYLSSIITLVLLSHGTRIGSPQDGDVQRSARALIQQCYEASGGSNWKGWAALEQAGTLVIGGIPGTFREIIDLKSGRDVTQFDVGPLHGKEASLPESTWEADQVGLATIHDGPESRADAATQSFIDRRGWFQASENELHYEGRRSDRDRSYDLVSIAPAGGRPITLWIDTADHLLKRIFQLDANRQPNTTFLSEYELVNGIRYASVIRDSNGNESQDRIKTVQSITLSPNIVDSVFAPPISIFRDAALVGEHEQATIPFTISDGRIVVNISLNGRAAQPFLLDTGGQNYLTPRAAELFGIKGGGNFAISGGGAQQENIQFARVEEMRLGPLKMSDQLFIVGELPAFIQDRGKLPPLAGLVGYELLRRFPATFNYQDRVLTFHKPGSTVPASADAQNLPLYFEGHGPYVRAEIDGVHGYFGIDTGDRSVTTLFAPFYNAHHFPVLQPPLEKRQGGVGGLQKALLTRVGDMSFGAWRIPHPLVNLNFAAQGAFASALDAGNIGYEILRKFVFTLDYEHRRILLQKSSDFGKAIDYNRSGMTLHRAESGAVEVETVSPHTPAAEVGLTPGDIILSINTDSPNDKALYELESLLSGTAGTSIRIEYRRGGKSQATQFRLRELLPSSGPMRPLTSP